MNVVHIITRMIIGGAQENTLHTVEDQHSIHGDTVTLITGPSEGPEGSLMDRASQGHFDIEIVPCLVRSIKPVQDLRAVSQLTRLLKEIQPDIVHTHSSKAGILGRFVAYRLGLPVVHTIHGSAFHYGQSAIAYHTYIAAEKQAARWTDHFISVCDDMSQTYLDAGIGKPEQFTTIYSGFDVDPFLDPPIPRTDVRRKYGIADEQIVVGKIGRLFHLKGHEFLIQAAEQVVNQVPDIRFLLVGDGILRQQFEEDIRKRGLSDHFIFTGLVPPSQIPELVHAMDIVAHTSQWEGLARVLAQGLIAGKSVISYNVGGAREIIRNGETGYLLPRDSVDELAGAIIELANDADLRARLGRTGRDLVTERYRHQFMTEQIRNVYKRVLDARATQS